MLDEIKAAQPTLTDHGPRHIRNVLKNAHELIADEIGKRKGTKLSRGALNGVELYVLGLSALFHDVGNMFDRKEHQKQIAKIYDFARPAQNGHQDHEEKKIILDICQAHCGKALDGTENTIRFVTERSKLEGKEIRPPLLASILRFADELAEGEQRTSHYMIQQHKYPKDSHLFHQYADCSEVDIDRRGSRIRLTYHITLRRAEEGDGGGVMNDGSIVPVNGLAEFLTFAYKRIEKLNQERQYAKHYCFLLNPFKETSASFNFWYRDRQIPIDLKAVVLSDLVVPGDPQRSVVDNDGRYDPTSLIGQLSETMNKMKNEM